MATDRLPGRTLTGALLLTAVALSAGGCGGNVVELDTASDFHRTIASDRPVLVMFWKWGCATCYALDPCMEQLAARYKGRATVARLMAFNFVFVSPVPELQARYEIYMVPTVILFVGGQEQQRWVMNYSPAAYEKALDPLVAPLTPTTPPVPQAHPADPPGESS